MLGIKRAGRRIADGVDRIYARVASPRRTMYPQRVLVVGIYKEPEAMGRALTELRRSAHILDVRLGAMASAASELLGETARANMAGGKFQNLNRLIPESMDGIDWLVIVDDDVRLPFRFLDRMLEVMNRLDLALAQPAQSRFSNANWSITRQRFLSLARETSFVEIGPVTILRADAVRELLPFPEDLRYGWGLDFRWAHLMQAAGLRMGIVDAATVVHASRKVASTYSWDRAQEEGRAFLADVAHLPTSVARGRGRRTHRLIARQRP